MTMIDLLLALAPVVFVVCLAVVLADLVGRKGI
jgi:hypothetical protein